jgi:hypothetical protein
VDIIIDYSAHPDLGGIQTIRDANTNTVVNWDALIGKQIGKIDRKNGDLIVLTIE